MILNPSIPCRVPRQSGGSTQIPSLTRYETKTVEFKDIETEAIEPEVKTSSPEELSLTGILGQIRIKYRQDL